MTELPCRRFFLHRLLAENPLSNNNPLTLLLLLFLSVLFLFLLIHFTKKGVTRQQMSGRKELRPPPSSSSKDVDDVVVDDEDDADDDVDAPVVPYQTFDALTPKNEGYLSPDAARTSYTLAGEDIVSSRRLSLEQFDVELSPFTPDMSTTPPSIPDIPDIPEIPNSYSTHPSIIVHSSDGDAGGGGGGGGSGSNTIDVPMASLQDIQHPLAFGGAMGGGVASASASASAGGGLGFIGSVPTGSGGGGGAQSVGSSFKQTGGGGNGRSRPPRIPQVSLLQSRNSEKRHRKVHSNTDCSFMSALTESSYDFSIPKRRTVSWDMNDPLVKGVSTIDGKHTTSSSPGGFPIFGGGGGGGTGAGGTATALLTPKSTPPSILQPILIDEPSQVVPPSSIFTANIRSFHQEENQGTTNHISTAATSSPANVSSPHFSPYEARNSTKYTSITGGGGFGSATTITPNISRRSPHRSNLNNTSTPTTANRPRSSSESAIPWKMENVTDLGIIDTGSFVLTEEDRKLDEIAATRRSLVTAAVSSSLSAPAVGGEFGLGGTMTTPPPKLTSTTSTTTGGTTMTPPPKILTPSTPPRMMSAETKTKTTAATRQVGGTSFSSTAVGVTSSPPPPPSFSTVVPAQSNTTADVSTPATSTIAGLNFDTLFLSTSTLNTNNNKNQNRNNRHTLQDVTFQTVPIEDEVTTKFYSLLDVKTMTNKTKRQCMDMNKFVSPLDDISNEYMLYDFEKKNFSPKEIEQQQEQHQHSDNLGAADDLERLTKRLLEAMKPSKMTTTKMTETSSTKILNEDEATTSPLSSSSSSSSSLLPPKTTLGTVTPAQLATMKSKINNFQQDKHQLPDKIVKSTEEKEEDGKNQQYHQDSQQCNSATSTETGPFSNGSFSTDNDIDNNVDDDQQVEEETKRQISNLTDQDDTTSILAETKTTRTSWGRILPQTKFEIYEYFPSSSLKNRVDWLLTVVHPQKEQLIHDFWNVVKSIMFPSFIIAMFLYCYCYDDDDDSQFDGNNNIKLTETTTTTTGSSLQYYPKVPLYSWILFIGCRHILLYEMTKVCQLLIVDYCRHAFHKAAGRGGNNVFGTEIMLCILQSKGMIFQLFLWTMYEIVAISMMTMMVMNVPTTAKPLNVLDSFSVIVSSPLYINIVSTSLFISIAITMKRYFVGQWIGRKLVGKYRNELVTLMKKLILIGEISQYAENISTKFPAMTTTTTTNTTKILTNKDLTATNTTNLTTATSTPSTDTSRSKVDEDEQIHTDDRVLDQEEIINDGDNVDGRGINSVDSFEYSEVANSVDVNKKKEILFEQQESNESINKSEMTSLLEQWEEPEYNIFDDQQEYVTFDSMLHFRKAINLINSDDSFLLLLSNFRTRNVCIEWSQYLFERLSIISTTRTKSNNTSATTTTTMTSDPMDFHILCEVASIDSKNGTNSDTTTTTATATSTTTYDKMKIQQLIHLFRPNRMGKMTKLEFTKSIDSVYKQLKLLQASIQNTSKIDSACERVVNIVFYTIVGFISLGIFEVIDISHLLLTFIGMVIGFVFLVGTNVGIKYIEGMLLILVRKPYDIGDRIEIDSVHKYNNHAQHEYSSDDGTSKKTKSTTTTTKKKSWIIEKFDLYTTTVRQCEGQLEEVATIANASLVDATIINHRRTENPNISFHLKCDMQFLTEQKLHTFRDRLIDYVHAKPREWIGPVSFQRIGITDSCHHEMLVGGEEMKKDGMTAANKTVNYLEYRIIIQHRSSLQERTAIAQSKEDILRYALELQRGLRI